MWETIVLFLLDILGALVNILPEWAPDMGTNRLNAFLAGVGKLDSIFPVLDFMGALVAYQVFCTMYGLARPWLKWIKAD